MVEAEERRGGERRGHGVVEKVRENSMGGLCVCVRVRVHACSCHHRAGFPHPFFLLIHLLRHPSQTHMLRNNASLATEALHTQPSSPCSSHRSPSPQTVLPRYGRSVCAEACGAGKGSPSHSLMLMAVVWY